MFLNSGRHLPHPPPMPCLGVNPEHVERFHIQVMWKICNHQRLSIWSFFHNFSKNFLPGVTWLLFHPISDLCGPDWWGSCPPPSLPCHQDLGIYLTQEEDEITWPVEPSVVNRGHNLNFYSTTKTTHPCRWTIPSSRHRLGQLWAPNKNCSFSVAMIDAGFTRILGSYASLNLEIIKSS